MDFGPASRYEYETKAVECDMMNATDRGHLKSCTSSRQRSPLPVMTVVVTASSRHSILHVRLSE